MSRTSDSHPRGYSLEELAKFIVERQLAGDLAEALSQLEQAGEGVTGTNLTHDRDVPVIVVCDSGQCYFVKVDDVGFAYKCGANRLPLEDGRVIRFLAEVMLDPKTVTVPQLKLSAQFPYKSAAKRRRNKPVQCDRRVQPNRRSAKAMSRQRH